jgi:hypothetical protein
VNKAQRSSWYTVLGLVSAGVGVLLAAGLEACFGVGRYRLIMLLGALGGFGLVLVAWLARRIRERCGGKDATLWLVAAGPVAAVFLVAFAWRILPLIREELRYNL